MDLLIAATAHAHNAAVYTRNPKEPDTGYSTTFITIAQA